MNQKQRLQAARGTSWIQKYSGKNPVQGYRKWFGVDIVCAITELKLLGVKIDPEYEVQVRRSVAQIALRRQARKLAKANAEEAFLSDWEDDFIFMEACPFWELECRDSSASIRSIEF